MAPHDRGGPEHDEVLELLPWYANASLEGPERARVEAHLDRCALCRAELAECQQLAVVVKNAPPPAPAPHPGSLDRLLARLDTAKDERPFRGSGRRFLGGRGLGGRSFGRVWAAAAPHWRRLALAQTLALVVLGVLLAQRPEPATPATFRTLASAPSTEPSAQLRVAFSEEVTEGELRRLLLPLSAQIVAGPSPLGVYTLRLPTGPAAEPLPVVVAHLSSQRAVRFVAVVSPGAE